MSNKPTAMVSVKYERKCNPELYLPGWSYESIGAAVELWDNVSADETHVEAIERLQILAEDAVQGVLADKIKKLQARSKRTTIEASREELKAALLETLNDKMIFEEMVKQTDSRLPYLPDQAEQRFFDALAEIIARNSAV